MSQSVLLDLEHNKKRLEYYQQLKAKDDSEKTGSYESVLNKWIEIYDDRIRKLEKQAVKTGMPANHPVA